jgi:hypothetical protein
MVLLLIVLCPQGDGVSAGGQAALPVDTSYMASVIFHSSVKKRYFGLDT